MTNQPTEHARSERLLDPRGSVAGRTLRAIVALLGLLAIASTASSKATAAEVVEVRVGRHPDFTRVVFELDRAAGYRIERSDPSSKHAELIVSLEAGSIPRRIQSSKSFIEQVVVEPSGGRSIARIRLAQGDLKLKEMILASPPRIVLDVISESVGKSGASTAAVSKPNATSKTSTTTALAANPVSKPTISPAPSAAARPVAPAPAAPPKTTSSAPAKPTQAVPAPAPTTKVLAKTDGSGGRAASAASSSAPAPGATAAATSAPTPAAPPGTAAEMAVAGNEAQGEPREWNDGANDKPADAAADAADPAGAAGAADSAMDASPAAADAAARANERPMMVKTDEGDAEGEGGGLMSWALVGAGLAVVAFGGLVIARRRRAAAMGEVDDVELAGEDEGEEVTSPFSESADDEEESEESTRPAASANPFAGLSGGAASFGGNTAREAGRPMRGTDRPADKHPTDKQADKQEKKPSESLLFDDAEETKMEGMEVISRSQANELGGAMPMMGAGSDELTQMFREMQRRVAALESRIDELVDARDRLERQVAAQTEELRVQRAAIARTQRAVRNLARPEDGGDDEPTEPALREPN